MVPLWSVKQLTLDDYTQLSIFFSVNGKITDIQIEVFEKLIQMELKVIQLYLWV